jgi:hypothetical protein
MNKLESLRQHQYMAISPENSVSVILKPAPRLLVLVTGDDLNDFDLTRQIWQLAKPMGLEVVLLALCNDNDQEAQLRRKLVTMTSSIHDETIQADFLIGRGNNWLKLSQQEWRPGDIFACGSEQYISIWGRLLSQTLASNFKTPVYILSDFHSSSQPMPKWLSTAIFWLGSISIIALFFEVEFKVSQLQQDWAHTALLYLCILAEAALIWIWNVLF